MVDRQAFKALLKHLQTLSDRLHHLVGDYRQTKIDDVTTETYQEPVLARNDINELKDMLGAVTASNYMLEGITKRNGLSANGNDKTLRNLLPLKEINRAADAILSRMESGDCDDIGVLKYMIIVDMYEGQ